jgi:hypothetical protein
MKRSPTTAVGLAGIDRIVREQRSHDLGMIILEGELQRSCCRATNPASICSATVVGLVGIDTRLPEQRTHDLSVPVFGRAMKRGLTISVGLAGIDPIVPE